MEVPFRAVPYLKKYVRSKDRQLARDAKEALAMHQKRRLEMATKNEQKNAGQEDAPDKK